MILLYSALETAIQEAARRYYLARNLELATTRELLKCCQDRRYQLGLFHGELGNWRAQNILMALHELPENRQLAQYKYQLTLLLFAILPPHYTHHASGWLAELLCEELIQGTYNIKETETKAKVLINTLSSRIFSMNIVRDSIQHSMTDYSSDYSTYLRYEKRDGIRYILRNLYLQIPQENKSGFDADLRQLEAKLIKQPKIDNSEMALSIQMR